MARTVTRRWVLTAAGAAVAAGVPLAIAAPSSAPASPSPAGANPALWRHRVDAAGVGPTAEALWLARGTVPGAGTPWADMVRYALVDLHQLCGPAGSVAAGPGYWWSFTWPRDAAFAVAAMARTGHLDQAWLTMNFLARVQHADGGFAARYRADGGQPPGHRPAQADGPGWVLWALGRLARESPDTPAVNRELESLLPMAQRAVGFVYAKTAAGSALPPPSPDYWELPESRVTLGIAGAMLAGLRGSALLALRLGDLAGATRATARADRFEDVVHDAFAAHNFQRYVGGGGHDAAVCLLMPPFVDAPRPGVVSAWQAYQRDALRPGGGLAPGTQWTKAGLSWTPETALVAYTAAEYAATDTASRWLSWLASHRTAWDSLPEKVLPNGAPAGPAPLGWTASSAILAADALDGRA